MPAHLMASNRTGNARIRAANPATDSRQYMAFATRMPAILGCVRRQPCVMLSPTTLSTAGPGVKSKIKLVTMNAMSVATVMALHLPHHVAAKAVDRLLAGDCHELYVARLSRLEPHGGASGDIEPHAPRLFAIEFQRRIGLEEMIVRAD